MPKDITLQANIAVYPLNNGVKPDDWPEGDGAPKFDEHAKEFVFEDPSDGQVIHYKMSGEMVKNIAGKLKMSNKGLDGVLRAEIEEQKAAAMKQGLMGGNGGMTPEQLAAIQAQARQGGSKGLI